ncbi:MAG: hypothetical protein IPO07_08755 [Haliscomenobacter sp.]|nr:hypothetical protein [Haliscomenobacter sp.]MBK9488867.1 hypothetical protein [Haliscomenobacter sp.]
MPQLQQEQHPYLEQGKVTGARSLVLGSFPVYECTNPDNEDKQFRRQKVTTRPYLRFLNKPLLFFKFKRLCPQNRMYLT